MTANDKLSFLIVGIGSVLFVVGLTLQNTYFVVPGLILILMGAAAYRGVK